jgi:hypothetical protein
VSRRWLLLTLSLLCALGTVSPWHAEARGRTSKKRRSPALSASYIRMRNRWHVRAPKAQVHAFVSRMPTPPLVLSPVGDAPDQTLLPTSTRGEFDEAMRDLAAVALADKHTHATHPIEPRLLDLVYQAALHFKAPFVHVVSGYRQDDGNSRHAQGRAVDLVLPGVSDKQLAAHLRTQGFVGVGVYSRSGFVHLDVRARSYFWSDSSGPSERSRPRPMPTTDLPDTPEQELQNTSETPPEALAP